jgi:hypothetical protein
MMFPTDCTSSRRRELTVPAIRFLREQDGLVERQLEGLLIRLFEQHSSVIRAYLAQVDVGGRLSVALCLRTASGVEDAILDAVGKTFAAMFNEGQHLDILFLDAAQEAALVKVCPAFFQRVNGPGSI